jgi:hypothetical protein
MNIKRYIQEHVLLPRLAERDVLVVYDPDRRYRELCLELALAGRRVIDATESGIESRAAAMAALQELGSARPSFTQLLLYVPARPPLIDDDRQRDPFALYAACGAIFPDPERDGDEYFSLCLQAKPDHATEIRRIFNDNPNPSFNVIDAIGGGIGWPHLQAALGVASAAEMLYALLVPSDTQKDALKRDDTWVNEAKTLLKTALNLDLKTRGKSWSAMSDEVWRFVLFSEFVSDLPAALPAALANVACAQPEAYPLIQGLCDRLRNDRRTQALYIEHAEIIERELNLPEIYASISDLGIRDTFPFEERSFFNQAVDALKRDNVDRLRELLSRHTHSVWVGRGENQAHWQLLQAAAHLIESCEDAERQLPDHVRTQDNLIDFYLTSLRHTDRLQREFEQAAADYFDTNRQMMDVISRAHTLYRRLANKVQNVFVRHLEQSGWPPTGRLANVDVFDTLVTPKLEESGRRVALLLIDALRYELGVELHKQLMEDSQGELHASFAQLPSITPVGMASLLPNAGQTLRIVHKNDKIVPLLGEHVLMDVSQRMDVLRQRYGQRFAEVPLADFVKGDFAPASTVDLLVIRSNAMDQDFESTQEGALGRISRTLQQIVFAVRKLRELRYRDALIVTDHGFYLNAGAEAGDVCTKPAGNWLTVHERMLLGNGGGDAANITLQANTVGILGEIRQIALPRAMVAYRAGQWYFHGGASLQEALVPVIEMRLRAVEASLTTQAKVGLAYKRGSKKITTRLPIIEICVSEGDLFSTSFDVLLEAHDKQGNVVGEAKLGGPVNPATQTITVNPGESVHVTLKMDPEFEGKFTVKALDPTTHVAFDTLNLETDYVV